MPSRLALLLALAFVACVSSTPEAPDGGDGEWSDGGADGGTDGGTDGGAPPSCDRASQARTADIALLDRARADLASASTAQARADIVAALFSAIEDGGGTPLVSSGGERVAFVARGAPASGYSVAGSWNGWQPGAQPLSQVSASELYAAELSIPRNGAHAYKLVDGQTFFEDRRAQHVVWDGFDRGGLGEFNAVVYPALADSSKGRLVALRSFPSAVLGDERDVFVYLPATYDRVDCPVLPSLYFHDGNESLTRSPFHLAADAEYASRPELSAVLVFVALPNQGVRMSQYTFGTSTSTGDQYLRFLREELKPELERRLRLCPKARDRGVGGASLGGLISGYAALELPETFGFVGSQSGSFFWESDAIATRVRDEPVVPVRWYLDHGCPGDNCDSNRLLADELQAKGYAFKRIEEPGGQHDWSYWRNRLPELLRYYREGLSGCAP